MHKLLTWTGRILFLFAVLFAILFLAIRTPDISVEQLKGKYASGASRFAAINGMQVHYRDEGPPSDSLPLLLLHGTGSSLHTWDGLVVRMPEKRIIRLDMPGYGLTGPHPQRDYSHTAMAAVLDELLKILGVDSCIVAGNSLGGYTAWTYALHNPNVKGLVLLDASGFWNPYTKNNPGFRMAQMPVIKHLVKYVTPRKLVRKSVEQTYGNPSLVNDELVQRYFDLNHREGNRQAMLDRFRKQESADTTMLKTLGIPVLILWGQKDQVIPVDHAKKFADYLPNDTLVIWPSLGHIPMEEAPDTVANTMKQWFMKHFAINR